MPKIISCCLCSSTWTCCGPLSSSVAFSSSCTSPCRSSPSPSPSPSSSFCSLPSFSPFVSYSSSFSVASSSSSSSSSSVPESSPHSSASALTPPVVSSAAPDALLSSWPSPLSHWVPIDAPLSVRTPSFCRPSSCWPRSRSRRNCRGFACIDTWMVFAF